MYQFKKNAYQAKLKDFDLNFNCLDEPNVQNKVGNTDQ